jgi:predicted nucleic acid-binding protein
MSEATGTMNAMTRYAIDAAVALRLVAEPEPRATEHQLVGPSVLRSHALSMLYRDVRAGRLDHRVGRERLEGLATLKIRLLGDRVSRSTAWRIAEQLGWDDTAMAEYLAVAVLQADALVTEDDRLGSAARDMIPLATYLDLLR